ncbi:gamma-glutamyltransferase family protein [Janibacter melonis]|uniref:gamma-glutamyltransferase family protein n=1 Tax=Janibacter melonis TaxID=262209 RepID=UPI0020950E1F|nr:gamma-glutamyltransferase [Janibacter melonis]
MTAPVAVAQDKQVVLGRQAAVSASHPLVTAEGARVLAEGGTAVDATLAMAAVSWVALPGQCGIGGDAFAVVREPDGRVWTVGGSGYGPDGADLAFFRDRGHTSIPLTGPLSVTVPGAPAALGVLAREATRPLSQLWARGIDLARHGFACTAKNRYDITERREPLAADPSTAACFLPDGRVPEVGRLLHQRDLADTLDVLADDPFAMYTGELAERALDFLRAGGAPFSGQEWALGAQVEAAPAITGTYRGLTVHQTPLPSAGWMMLHQAALLDGLLADGDLLDAASVAALAGAARAAFDDRYALVGSDTDAWRALLDPERVARQRAGLTTAGPVPASPDGDTTSMVCVDAEGRSVSFIHSLAFTFGARITVPGTGVVLGNRLGRGAYLVEGHPNEVRPRRKPLHTLNAWVADDADGLRHVGSCPGGDGQVQWNMQVLSHLVDHGLDPQQAVSLPRLSVFPGSDADVVGSPAQIRVEAGLGPQTIARLRADGHDVVETPVQVFGPGGSAMAISKDPTTGVLSAGADPRMEGMAIAW